MSESVKIDENNNIGKPDFEIKIKMQEIEKAREGVNNERVTRTNAKE